MSEDAKPRYRWHWFSRRTSDFIERVKPFDPEVNARTGTLSWHLPDVALDMYPPRFTAANADFQLMMYDPRNLDVLMSVFTYDDAEQVFEDFRVRGI